MLNRKLRLLQTAAAVYSWIYSGSQAVKTDLMLVIIHPDNYCTAVRSCVFSAIHEFADTTLSCLQDARPSKIKVQRFYRPEDISKDEAYKASFWDVYASPEPPGSSSSSCEWVQWIDVDCVVQKCAAKAVGDKVPEGETVPVGPCGMAEP